MKASPRHYAQALYLVLSESTPAERSKTIQEFLTRLYAQGDLKTLSEIVRIVDEMEQAATGTLRVTVATAHELDIEVLTPLVKKIISGEDVIIETELDSELIGGMRLETKDHRWDLSARGQLQQLAYQLNN